MPFAAKTHSSLFPASRRRPSLAQAEESEVLASDTYAYSPHQQYGFSGIQPSASTSWINPFGRASMSVEDDSSYVSPVSLPSSRRPSAVTIISTLLHRKSIGQNSNASSSTVRLSQDGYTSGSDDAGSPSTPTAASVHAGRRPSAIFKAWKARRASSSAQALQPPQSSMLSSTSLTSGGHSEGRRKSSALTRVLQSSTLRNGSGRVDEHSLSSSDTESNGRRRSLSIVCRGERDSIELLYEGPSDAQAGQVTAAMAIRDTWLYGSHQWTPDGRKGSVSTIATSPTYSNHLPRKSISGSSTALGLDIEDQQVQHQHLQERLRQIRNKGVAMTVQEADDAASVVSLSLTEEIALYTTDVQTVEYNAGKARGSVASAEMARGARSESGKGAFVWDLPDWGAGRQGLARLPELSPAPELMIADPFVTFSQSASQEINEEERNGMGEEMQRVESGALDPDLSPGMAYSPTLLGVSEANASDGHGSVGAREGDEVQWNQPQWNVASPFRPDATEVAVVGVDAFPKRPSLAHTSSWYSATDQSPTAPNFPVTISEEVSTGSDDKHLTDDVAQEPSQTQMEESPRSRTAEIRRALRPSSKPKSPQSPRSFGTSASSYEMQLGPRRLSYSHPRPPPEYEISGSEPSSTPRLVGEWAGSPMSSLYGCETPHQAEFAELVQDSKGVASVDEEDGDLHAQFCSVLLLDLGDGRAIPLRDSPGLEARPDLFSLAC